MPATTPVAAMGDTRTAGRSLRSLFIATLVTGSFLLFLIQPLFARLVLPVLGGSPSVWNTAMLFYQSALLLGYTYAHGLQRLPFRTQAMVHVPLFTLAALTLPIGIARFADPATGDTAVWWLLKLLMVSIGPVFVMVAAQAPLMQAWFARSADKSAASPFFLYAASNFGSLAGLLAYPFLLEPFTTLGFQQHLWSAGYVVLLALTVGCAFAIVRTGDHPPATVPDTVTARGARPVTWPRRLYWVALAAVPSGLMLSTTTHITTDIMAMPLLWVLPLTAYLLSFILAFSGAGPMATRLAVLAAPAALLVFGVANVLLAGMAATVFGMFSIALLFVVAVALHGTLALDRPPAAQLTGYYLLMSVGGVVGGVFAALVAPELFDWVYEHPILLLAAALLVPARPLTAAIGNLWVGNRLPARALRILSPPLLLVLSWWLGASLDLLDPPPAQAIALLVMVTITILAIGRPLQFTWGLMMLMLAFGGWQQIDISTIKGARQRSFFGIYTIENSNMLKTRRLLHGTTLHGAQSLDPGFSRQPMTYYAPDSGIGQAMRSASTLFGARARIAVVGLGTGSLVCYASPLEDWTVFEIDPMVVRLATNPAVFSFVSQCRPDLRIIVGDARLKLAEQPANRFDLLAIDAFSSDAIPLHLLTREAFETYFRTLSRHGILMVHISNRFLDLEPVVAAIARDLGLTARQLVYAPKDSDVSLGYNASIWIALSRTEDDMTNFTEATGDSSQWLPLRTQADVPGWTDEFASIIPVLKPFWKE